MSQDLRSQPWVRIFQDLTAELPGLVGGRLGLLALELRRLERRRGASR